MKNEIKLIKNKSDIGAGTRGADMGIDAMEIAAININNHFFQKHPFIEVKTHNESIYNKVNFTSAKRIKSVVEQCQRVSNAVQESILKNEFPIVLSGDHSSALGTISGIKSAKPNSRLGVIWIDAHADMHSPYTTPSGNIHGMPLAAALQLDNLEMKVNNIDEDVKRHWNNLKTIGTKEKKFHPEDLIYFGVRDTEEPEDYVLASKSIKNYTVSEMRFRGFVTCLNEAIGKLKHCDSIYLSFDVDSLDCDFVSDGTGTPVPFGFSPEEAKEIIKAFLKTEKLICAEFVEVNPLLDTKGNRMAETAFDILHSCFT